MYQFSYAEILDESGTVNRERERLALDHAVDLLTRAEAAGPGSGEVATAVTFLQKLWSFFIADLADPHNALPQPLKADLASLGLWVMQESDRLINNQPANIGLLISVNRAMREGLK